MSTRRRVLVALSIAIVIAVIMLIKSGDSQVENPVQVISITMHDPADMPGADSLLIASGEKILAVIVSYRIDTQTHLLQGFINGEIQKWEWKHRGFHPGELLYVWLQSEDGKNRPDCRYYRLTKK